jgi:hypothetical protein
VKPTPDINPNNPVDALALEASALDPVSPLGPVAPVFPCIPCSKPKLKYIFPLLDKNETLGDVPFG